MLDHNTQASGPCVTFLALHPKGPLDLSLLCCLESRSQSVWIHYRTGRLEYKHGDRGLHRLVVREPPKHTSSSVYGNVLGQEHGVAVPPCLQYRGTTSFPKTFATRGAGVVRLDHYSRLNPGPKLPKACFSGISDLTCFASPRGALWGV